MRIRNGYFSGVMLLLACLAVTAVGLLLPAEVGCDASGCSLVQNASPSYYGCLTSPGNSCYECYYSGGGGTSMCYENGPGSVKYCIDYQY